MTRMQVSDKIAVNCILGKPRL